MPKSTDELSKLYSKFVASRSDESRKCCEAMDQKNVRTIRRMARLGVVTVGDLLNRLPDLSNELMLLGIWLISIWKIRRAANVLLKLMQDEAVRIECACALDFMDDNPTITKTFLKIGQRELSAVFPNPLWLSAVIHGLKYSSNPKATDLLVTIFERHNLPGHLRGDAGDALFCHSLVVDRRTKLHRRCREAAIIGLQESNVEVKFWSMYVLAFLATSFGPVRRTRDLLREALPFLRQIKRNDHRLAPGFWWTMSAEAEDAIHRIEKGVGKSPDAADRWLGNKDHGPRDFT